MNNKEINKANGIETINLSHLESIIEKKRIQKAERIEYSRQYNKQVLAYRKELRKRNKEQDRIEAQKLQNATK
jgi:hypothetical protein